MSDPPSSSNLPAAAPAEPLRSIERAHDDIREHKRYAVEEERKASDALIQASLLGGPAAILASITFLKEIAPNPIGWSAPFLLISWVAYIFGAWSALSSLQRKRAVARDLDNLIEKKLDAGEPRWQKGDFEPLRVPNEQSERAGVRAMRSFQIGTVSIILFAALNLPFWNALLTNNTKSGSKTDSTRPDAVTTQKDLLELCQERGCTITVPGKGTIPEKAAPVRPASKGPQTTPQRTSAQ